MKQKSKRLKEGLKQLDLTKNYSLGEAIGLLQGVPSVKFDQSVELALKLGIDPKKSDQQVRSTMILPHGTGKTLSIVVLAKGEKVKEALDAGADHAGDQELIDKMKKGWTSFDVLIVTPDMMREVGKHLGKILGPVGLMPTPKGGTVTTDVKRAVEERKRGKIEFKGDKSGVINQLVGKLSFPPEHLTENIQALLTAISRMKPPSAKGQFLRSLVLASTMGPGIKVDLNRLTLS